MTTETKLGHIADVPVQVGIPAGIANPVKPALFAGKSEAQLGKRVGMSQFGVNHLSLKPGAISALRHWHEGEDEFVYVLDGELTLVDDNGEHRLRPGSFVGFPAGATNAHHLINKSQRAASFLVIGTRKVGREVIHYPDDPVGPVTIDRDSRGERM